MKFSLYIPFIVFVCCLTNTFGQDSKESVYHTVKSSENIYRISLFYNVAMDSIRIWNNLDLKYTVFEGMKLIIRHPKPIFSNKSESGKITDNKADTLVRLIPDNHFHIVAPLENVFRISLKYKVTVDSVRIWNNLDRYSTVSVGQKLIISGRKPELTQTERAIVNEVVPLSPILKTDQSKSTDNPIVIIPLVQNSDTAKLKETALPKGYIPSDSLLSMARKYAYSDKKPDARNLCRLILSRDSTYWDAAVLIGRTYIWDNKYDSARIVLNKIIGQRPGYYDAIDARIDAEIFSDNYPEAIKYADIALSYHPNDDTFLFKKARALNKSGNSKEASTILNKILGLNPSDQKSKSLLSAIRLEKMVNKLTLNYWIYVFNDNAPWSFASAAIGHKTTKLGTITLRYNYAGRFGNEGHQIELDAYPAIAKGIYMYFSTAISNKKNFPYSRLSMEPYFKLPASFEMSVGFRYLNFDDDKIITFGDDKVLIYTGSIGKYWGDYWFSLKPYLTPGKDAWSQSANLTIRRYLNGADNYLSLILGTGISPDEQQYAFDPVLYYLKSNKIAIEYQQKIGSRLFFDSSVGYSRDEVSSDTKRDRYTFDFGLSFIF